MPLEPGCAEFLKTFFLLYGVMVIRQVHWGRPCTLRIYTPGVRSTVSLQASLDFMSGTVFKRAPASRSS
jgi:hypothetical protein